MPSSPSPDAQGAFFGCRKLGRYELLTPLASGGMGTVFAARTTGIGGFERIVAVKVLHPHMAQEVQFITMFLDEARLAARIRHPNVVSVLDVSGGGREGFFLVMEYVEGAHLGALMSAAREAGERLPPPVAFRIVTDALSGLRAAHMLKDKNGDPLHIVHRDVSPQNLLVGLDGVSRLTDFGIAKAEARLTQTHHGSFKGKAAYASPEQVKGEGLDQRSDLFSVGIVLWEALAGRRLFQGDGRKGIADAVLVAEIPALSEVDALLAPYDGVVQRALAQSPDERFQSAEEFIVALEEAAGTDVAAARVVSATVREYAGDSLEAEALRINEAARSAGVRAVVERDQETTAVAERDPRRRTARGSVRQPGGPPRHRPASVLGLGVLLLLVGAVGWLALRARAPGSSVPDDASAVEGPSDRRGMPGRGAGSRSSSPPVTTAAVPDASEPGQGRSHGPASGAGPAVDVASEGGRRRPADVPPGHRPRTGGGVRPPPPGPYEPGAASMHVDEGPPAPLQVRPNPYLR